MAITVEEVIKDNNDSSRITKEQNEELLKTGAIKAKKQSYLPWVILGLAALGFGWWLWKNKGNQNDGSIPG